MAIIIIQDRNIMECNEGDDHDCLCEKLITTERAPGAPEVAPGAEEPMRGADEVFGSSKLSL